MESERHGIKGRPQRLVLVGSVLVDILLYVGQLPERGGDRIAEQAILTTGGGLNVLVAAARLGMSVTYAGRVGDGPMGHQVMADLEKAGIPLLLPRVQGEDSGFDIGLVESDAERTFVTSPGAESRLQETDLAEIALLPGDSVYISGYDLCYPLSGKSLGRWLPELGADILLVLDPGPLAAEIPAERLTHILKRTDILSLNKREAYLLTGVDDAREAAIQLAGRIAPGGTIVARMGAEGCWLVQESGRIAHHIPARATAAVDTTGAGDAHVGALLAQLSTGNDIFAAARIANIAASLSTERSGPSTSPTMQELIETLNQPPT
jgi:sugar/nucleoside kinase (ribokinase family)